MRKDNVVFCERNIRINYSGKKFNRLTVITPVGVGKYKKNETVYLCKCDCGSIKYYTTTEFKKNLSCGCQRSKVTIGKNLKHGMYKTAERRIWAAMKSRCYNKNTKSYTDYGARGIVVCDRWKNTETGFINFYKDMGPRPSKEHSIDRIDNEKGYFPGNCKWSTTKEQSRNKRNNLNIEYEGKTLCLKDWAKELNIKYHTLHDRLYRYKWSVSKAFTVPIAG